MFLVFKELALAAVRTNSQERSTNGMKLFLIKLLIKGGLFFALPFVWQFIFKRCLIKRKAFFLDGSINYCMFPIFTVKTDISWGRTSLRSNNALND